MFSGVYFLQSVFMIFLDFEGIDSYGKIQFKNNLRYYSTFVDPWPRVEPAAVFSLRN